MILIGIVIGLIIGWLLGYTHAMNRATEAKNAHTKTLWEFTDFVKKATLDHERATAQIRELQHELQSKLTES